MESNKEFKDSDTMQMVTREQLIAHLISSRKIVESWPDWKRQVLGVDQTTAHPTPKASDETTAKCK